MFPSFFFVFFIDWLDCQKKKKVRRWANCNFLESSVPIEKLNHKEGFVKMSSDNLFTLQVY